MTWLRDLGLGIRFAAAGGREGWARTALTAVGVGLGVALLLIASSVPHLLAERAHRDLARQESAASYQDKAARSDTSVLRINAETEYRGQVVGGFLMRPEGAHPVTPPGVGALPGPGEMVASPHWRSCSVHPRAAFCGSVSRTGSPRRSAMRASSPPASCTSTPAATP